MVSYFVVLGLSLYLGLDMMSISGLYAHGGSLTHSQSKLRGDVGLLGRKSLPSIQITLLGFS